MEQALVPDGIDVVFENVGNRMVDAVLPHMKVAGRIVVCGQTADYNVAPGQQHGIRNTRNIVGHRLLLQGLLAMDYVDRYEEARSNIRTWAREGRLITKKRIDVGLESLPASFCALFKDDSELGRRLVVAEPLHA